MTCALLLPSFDLPSRSASGMILRHIAPRVEPFQLYGPLARRPFFSFVAPKADVIIAVGHGEDDELSAQGKSMIWKVGQYDQREVQGKVIVLIACRAGIVLGPDLVDHGARCVIGFDDDVIWVTDSKYSPQPWNDPFARACLTPLIDCLHDLLDGKTCGEAMSTQLEGYFNSAQATDYSFLRSCLDFNRQHAVLIGDPEATVRPRPRISLPPPPPLLI